MRFSVIIPTFKRAQLLGDAIRAALAQTHANREILVVDDGSPDPRSVASTFGEAVRYFRQENKGKSAALNLGISASTGDATIVLENEMLPRIFPLVGLSHFAVTDRRHLPTSGMRNLFRRTIPAVFVTLMEICFVPNPAWGSAEGSSNEGRALDESMYYRYDYDMIPRLARTNEGVFFDDPMLYQRKHLSYREPSAEGTFILDTVGKGVNYDALHFKKLDRRIECDLYYIATGRSCSIPR
jgi:glycosyltransferase involved in cell wall biosynthesis